MAVFETHGGSSSVDKDGIVSLTRTVRVYTGVLASRPTWAVLGVGINRFDPHPDDATCLAISVSANPIADELGWFDLSYTYTNKPFDVGTAEETEQGADPQAQPDPTDRSATLRWGTVTRTEAWQKDAYDKALVNSARQPYNLEHEIIHGLITINFNLDSAVDVGLKQQKYVNTVNLAQFSIVPKYSDYLPYTLRCNSWNATLQFEADKGWYCACEVEFERNPFEWDRRILDSGFYEMKAKAGGGEIQEKFVGRTGQGLDTQVPLDGFGKRLSLNPPRNFSAGEITSLNSNNYEVKDNNTANVAVYRVFSPHKAISWTNILSVTT